MESSYIYSIFFTSIPFPLYNICLCRFCLLWQYTVYLLLFPDVISWCLFVSPVLFYLFPSISPLFHSHFLPVFVRYFFFSRQRSESFTYINSRIWDIISTISVFWPFVLVYCRLSNYSDFISIWIKNKNKFDWGYKI